VTRVLVQVKDLFWQLGRIPRSLLCPLHPAYLSHGSSSLTKATCACNKIAWVIQNQQTLSSGSDPLNSNGSVLSLLWQTRDSKDKGHCRGPSKSQWFRGAEVSLKAMHEG